MRKPENVALAGNDPDAGVEEHYAEAPGSGAAAILAFLHIALCGVLGYGSYYLVRYANEGLLASPNLSWQFLIPAGLALALYIPTNPLTKVLSATAFAFGVIAVVALLIALGLTLSDQTRQFADMTTGRMLSQLSFGVVAAAVVSLATRWLFLRTLPARDSSKL